MACGRRRRAHIVVHLGERASSGPIAQRLEQATHNALVSRSILVGPNR